MAAFRIVPRSLTARVIALSTIWAVLALLAIATVITTLYRQASADGFEKLLSAHLFSLIGSVGVSSGGSLIGHPDLGDLRYSEPGSGWYWSVEPVSQGTVGILHSPSMTRPIPSPSVLEVPFSSDFQRSYEAEGINSEKLAVVESEFVLDSRNRVARFRVMGNLSEMEAEVDGFKRQLYTYLSLFGVGMIAINAMVILFGLQPLQRVSAVLAQLREGSARRLDGSFPAEIEPLASETNALIDNNRRIVERSRTQVGNLAHSLKTPLAVLLNEGQSIGGDRGRLIAEQALAMQRQLDHYLQRARIAAQRNSVVYRTPVCASIRRVTRVMEKLNPDIHMRLFLPSEEYLFAGEQGDFEEISGNLLENAMKWATSSVVVSIAPAADGNFILSIEDDGPGIPETEASEALKRGQRLDESKPGTGLGLAIVADLINEYGGRLTLEEAVLGGLKVVVELKRTQ